MSLHRLRKLRTRGLRLAFLLAIPALLFVRPPWPGGAIEMSLEIMGQAFVAAGILGRLWCTLYIGGRKSRTLVTSGPYAVCRNPLYLFSSLLGTGIALLLQNVILLLLFAVLFVLFHALAICGEEENLRQRFGHNYEEYCRDVPRFLPKPWRLAPAAQIPALRFSPRHLTRGLIEASAYFLVIPLAEVLEHLYHCGLLPL